MALLASSLVFYIFIAFTFCALVICLALNGAILYSVGTYVAVEHLKCKFEVTCIVSAKHPIDCLDSVQKKYFFLYYYILK